ncbi:glutamic acid-rich protein-like [Nilaparvata lugens]|uniref:glutamic acid-rich protein-like n=1 Tax=Nilaparvata lugens TaxID=108931 RepID=UPI00193E4AC7|nr:glutamic acid-rich protein-like [Nilaparvata lugens]
MRVCSLHFSKNDFILNGKDVKKPFANLKKTAIPRRNLPLRKNSKLSTRLQVRGFNRLKWRGRLAFQDLDARVPMSRNPPIKSRKVVQKFEGGVQQNVKKPTEVVEESKENEEEEECMEVVGFSLASLEDGTEKLIGLDGDPENTEKDQVTSEFIIKEEPLSDNEQEIDEWTEENIIAEVERSETENQGNDWTTNPPPTGDNSQQQVITTQSVLHDLESSGDEQEINKKKKKKSDEGAREEEEEINKKQKSNDEETEETREKAEDEEEEDEIRDRPCKWCGKRDCRGHNGEPQRPAAFVCVVCNELFQTPAQLDAHSERHDEEMNGYGNSWHDDFAYRSVFLFPISAQRRSVDRT